MEIAGVSNGAAGLEGLTWEKKDGKAVFTEFGKKALSGENPEVPKRWGGGKWSDNMSALNYKALSMVDTDPHTGEPYLADMWSCALDAKNSKLIQDWRSKNNNAKTSIEFLQKKNALAVASGSSYIAPKENQEISTIRRQCKPIITDYSWKMIFAKNESEFKSLLEEMQSKLYGMGYHAVLSNDIENARAEISQRKQEEEAYHASN